MQDGGMTRCRMTDEECHVAEGELQRAADEQGEVEVGGRDEGQNSEPMAEASSGPVVGPDSHCVMDHPTNDTNDIMSDEGTDVAGRPGQGDGVAEPPWRFKTPKSAERSHL